MFKKICKMSLNARCIHINIFSDLPLAKRDYRLKKCCLLPNTTLPLECNQLPGLVPSRWARYKPLWGWVWYEGCLAELQQPNRGQRKIDPSVCFSINTAGCSAGGHFLHKVSNKEIICEIYLTRPPGARVSPVSSRLPFVGGKQRDV